MARRGGQTYKKNKKRLFQVNLDKFGKYTCELCYKAPLYRNQINESRWRTDLLTADHIVPISKGGGNSFVNLRAVCGECNHERDNNVD
jgi:5-methylcytosine-specific restriction endonuclease McrA